MKGHLGEVGSFGCLFGIYAGNQGVQQGNAITGLESLDLVWVIGIRCGVRITVDDVLGLSALPQWIAFTVCTCRAHSVELVRVKVLSMPTDGE